MIDYISMVAMVDEMKKIAMAAPNPLKALKINQLSTNVSPGARSSINTKMPTIPAAPPVGRVTTLGGSSVPTSIAGANIRPKAVGNLNANTNQLLRQENLRAGPGHIAQSTPSVPMTAQGQAPKVSTPAPTGGTVGGGQPSAGGLGGRTR